MAVWQGQASNIPVKGTASIVVKVLQQSSYCSFALDPFVKTLWAWMMLVYSSGYKAFMNLSLYICWWVICRSVVGWLGVGYPQVSCQICGNGGHPTIDCPQKHFGTNLGQVYTLGRCVISCLNTRIAQKKFPCVEYLRLTTRNKESKPDFKFSYVISWFWMGVFWSSIFVHCHTLANLIAIFSLFLY
jgi:hypothetical protein